MTVAADANGVARGRFTIPTNVPVGTKSVTFLGSDGSYGEASYVGHHTINRQTLRNVLTLTTTQNLRLRVDPLAQTFTLAEDRHIAAIDLWFKKKGNKSVRLQIRETQNGVPNQTVIAETTLQASEIKLDEQYTRFNFTPVFLSAGQEYAFVVLTDDDIHEVALAELGKYDRNNGWVTRQPYQVGVLLSSSNAQTWTPHQTMDLSFTIHGAKFSSNTRSIDLGSIQVEQVSDLMALLGVELTGEDTDIALVITTEDEERFVLQHDQPINLPKRISGELRVSAELKGTSNLSPVLYPGIQAITGKLRESADYVTRAIPCGDDSEIKVTLDGLFPGAANLQVEAEVDGSWTAVPFSKASALADGWEERSYVLQNITTPQVRVKLKLSGTAADRPRVRNLRVITV